MMKSQEMIFIHKPGADDMTLSQRLNWIGLRGHIKVVIVLQRDKHTIPTSALISWLIDPNNPLNKQRL